MTTPSLRQLDIFAQMVAAGDIVRCADDLGVSPADICREIAALEGRLGFRLFDDIDGIARLTPAGRKTAQAMTRLSQAAPDDWDEQDVGESGRSGLAGPVSDDRRSMVVLAAPPAIFSHFQDRLLAFEAANEDISITLDLHVQSAADAASVLAAGKADIAYFYALEESSDIPSRYGWSEQLSIYAGKDHPLALSDGVALADLAITPLLAMDLRNGMQQLIDDALIRGGIVTGPPILQTDDLFQVVTALRNGNGCFAAFGAMARDLGRMSGIKRLALEIRLPTIEVRQAVGPRAAQTAAVEALADFLFL